MSVIVVLALRSLVYSLTSDILMKQLNQLLEKYQVAVDYYEMELSTLFLPTDYLILKRSIL